jgi:hypothetical protein
MPPLRHNRRKKGRSRKREEVAAMLARRTVAERNRLNHYEPVRGVKLRTISMGTLIFALACLAAFVAGRPPASGAYPGAPRAVARQGPSGSRLGQRQAGENANARTPERRESGDDRSFPACKSARGKQAVGRRLSPSRRKKTRHVRLPACGNFAATR